MCVPQPYITGETDEVEAKNTSPVPVLPKIGSKPLLPSSPLPKIGGTKQGAKK